MWRNEDGDTLRNSETLSGCQVNIKVVCICFDFWGECFEERYKNDDN